MPEYFLILLFLFLTALFLHLYFKVKIYHSFAHFVLTNFAGILIITVWDSFAIYRGHWSFGQKYLLGLKIGLMPVKEYFFVLIFPYLGLVIYKILEKKLKSADRKFPGLTKN
ncbi:lycopene cyclase domain-containing protein [Patescibacteria group bacterium]|nr:lycopene cyclase domain-containing protein [Patescibacteria group bacterium]